MPTSPSLYESYHPNQTTYQHQPKPHGLKFLVPKKMQARDNHSNSEWDERFKKIFMANQLKIEGKGHPLNDIKALYD